MLRIECIAIGSELLTLPRLDTNSVWLAERLGEMGLSLGLKTCVGDDRDSLRRTLREALDRSDLILCTGGLGPTFDDFTKEIWAEVLDVPLLEDPASRASILTFFNARKRPVPEANFKQALIPLGAQALHNPAGTAPGVWWEDLPGYPGKRAVLFPGVPREMKVMWENHVAPRLKPFAGRPVRTLRMVFGSVSESALEERARPLRERHANLEWTILAGLNHVELLGRGTDEGALAAALADFRQELGPDLAFTGPEGGIEDTVLALLRDRHQTLAVAESMTGGALAAKLTSVAGASLAFLGGATVYSPAAKAELAGVDSALIREEGTVSLPVTRALAEGIRGRLKADWALAVTGNAGPTADPGAQADLGTVHAAVAGPDGTRDITFHLFGSRADIQTRAVAWSLDFLRRILAGRPAA